ncbi:DNA/RNA non-specific endonuclease [Streptomyces sp. SID13031]|uniref:DNA/RNA non-specific endonuclease n=1 Tax=Streptomyces sp. SID13031 TaxID=2706046 RepID=UPI0013C54ACA|nr:DNA/RNA non-specific endonuclease [Streptomyces sp. SID13031]NEA31015.1 DNA/RNA non-specific endonuclease [Streptomyces sp. SID13031]
MAAKRDTDAPSAELSAALREFIRTNGSSYLKDPNVSSIGIGYKIRDGKQTKEVSIQFTVNSKAEPEALGALSTVELPKSITVAGAEIPTDVIERSYSPDFRVVPEADQDERKVRIDPLRPGVSVGHQTITAGTIGAIVYDAETGRPCVLSNWHVLQGEDGQPGDIVVQPGPFDDNRTDRNHLGPLLRSYLGIAGDGAIAGVEGRDLDPSVLELDVVPEELGDPELGDKVVKSGRTTGVTHGIVRRVDTIAKINYGAQIGVVEIGGFEIGVDPGKRPSDDEVSKGGDSGAAWLFKSANGRPSKVLAGIHFAGEGASDPDEHALACLPRSLFQKLGITLAKPEGAVGGFDPNFLSSPLPVPGLDPAASADAVELDGSPQIDYTHFSLTMSRSRGFAHWVAWNVDGGDLKKISRTGIPFVKDPRLPAGVQNGDELYRDNRLDRGHLARRADLLWGSLEEAEQANRDSFFFTNITPQMDDFNQSSRDGLWGRLEDAVFADVDVDDLRVSVYGGPVFGADDRVFRGVKIPREFWKVIVFAEAGVLKASAFLLTQNLDQLESLELDEFRVFQLPVAELENRTDVQFPAAIHSADTAPALPEAVGPRPPLVSLSEIVWT